MYTLIVTAKLNAIDPLAWLADVLGWIASHPPSRLKCCCRGTGSAARCCATKPPDMPAISAILTINHVATMLGDDEDWLDELP